MNNNLREKICASFFFFLMGIFFLPSFMFLSFPLKNAQLFYFLLSGILFGWVGYIYGYKSLLTPADNLSIFITRSVAGIWGSTFAMLVGSLIPYVAGEGNKFLILTYYFLSVPIGFWLGWYYGYKLLLFPKIKYEKLFPTWSDRSIAAVWFGLAGFCAARLGHRSPIEGIEIFITIFAGYLGFAYGWRVLALPSSLLASLKAIMIGFIGSCFALIVFLLILAMGMNLKLDSGHESFQLYTLVDHIVEGIGTLLFIYIIVIWFTSIVGIIFSLILYLIGIIKNKITL